MSKFIALPFLGHQELRPNKKPPTFIRQRFSISRWRIFVSAISRCTSHQKHPFLIQSTLRLHLVGCQTSSRKSFLMFYKSVIDITGAAQRDFVPLKSCTLSRRENQTWTTQRPAVGSSDWLGVRL